MPLVQGGAGTRAPGVGRDQYAHSAQRDVSARSDGGLLYCGSPAERKARCVLALMVSRMETLAHAISGPGHVGGASGPRRRWDVNIASEIRCDTERSGGSRRRNDWRRVRSAARAHEPQIRLRDHSFGTARVREMFETRSFAGTMLEGAPRPEAKAGARSSFPVSVAK